MNNGTCIDGVSEYSCHCVTGFTGQHCQININDCVNVSCQNEAVCRDLINSYHCDCPPGYEGKI